MKVQVINMELKKYTFSEKLKRGEFSLKTNIQNSINMPPWDGKIRYTVCCESKYQAPITSLLGRENIEFLPYSVQVKIPAEFVGQLLIVYNRDDMTVLKDMVDMANTGVGVTSVGSKSLRCLVPSPDAFSISRDVLSAVGGFDEIFELPHIRLADFVSRVIELGVGESVAVDGVRYNFPPCGIDGELFIAKHGYAVPQSDELSDLLLDTYLDNLDNLDKVLVIANRIPLSVDRLYSPTGSISLICSDNASVKACELLLNSQHTANNINELNLPENTYYDTIILYQSAYQIQNFTNVVKSLRNMLRPNGKLLFFEENIMGLHRLGKFLTDEVRNGVPKSFSPRTLTQLKIPFTSKTVYCDLDKLDNNYEAVVDTLMQAYPANALPMRNTLSLKATLYSISALTNQERGGNADD